MPYLDALAERVRGFDGHVVFTAHSLPARILDEGDPYQDELPRDFAAHRRSAGLVSWSFAYQSASPTGEPGWARTSWTSWSVSRPRGRARARLPDRLRLDHLEILWDIDVEARERAGELGLELDRIDSLNDDPAFIRGLADLVSVPSIS